MSGLTDTTMSILGHALDGLTAPPGGHHLEPGQHRHAQLPADDDRLRDGAAERASGDGSSSPANALGPVLRTVRRRGDEDDRSAPFTRPSDPAHPTGVRPPRGVNESIRNDVEQGRPRNRDDGADRNTDQVLGGFAPHHGQVRAVSYTVLGGRLAMAGLTANVTLGPRRRARSGGHRSGGPVSSDEPRFGDAFAEAQGRRLEVRDTTGRTPTRRLRPAGATVLDVRPPRIRIEDARSRSSDSADLIRTTLRSRDRSQSGTEIPGQPISGQPVSGPASRQPAHDREHARSTPPPAACDLADTGRRTPIRRRILKPVPGTGSSASPRRLSQSSCSRGLRTPSRAVR